MEINDIEIAIRDKAKEWVGEYGIDFLIELIGDYLGDAAERLPRLRNAVATGDARTVMHEAHTLKSSSANLGAPGLSALASRLEEIGRDGDLTESTQYLEWFEDEFTAVKANLEELRDAPEAYIARER
jgi:HPt (histidine-containing phosphotransfer) domain-containing protein